MLEIKSRFDHLIKGLEWFKISGFTIEARIIWIIVTRKETIKKKLTTLILFNPAVHKIINSLSSSNFKIVRKRAIKNDNGMNFVNIFEIFKNEYPK